MAASRGGLVATVGVLAMVIVVCLSGSSRSPVVMTERMLPFAVEGSPYNEMCATACEGHSHLWGPGGSARTCAICRLAFKQAQLHAQKQSRGAFISLHDVGGVWSTVEEDQHGVTTPTSIPAGGDDDMMVDGEGMIYFPEEFSGCFDNGDNDDFRNQRRIDCVHEARRGWYDKGAHVLDADGLSIDDLAPSEVKHRIMTYCMVRFQNEDAGQTQLCYEALVDALTGAPEPVHIRLRWDDPMPHPAEDYEDADDLAVAGKPARQGGGGPSVGSIIAAYVEGMCANSDGMSGAASALLCGE